MKIHSRGFSFVEETCGKKKSELRFQACLNLYIIVIQGTSFQNGKARGQSGHNSISTSGVSVAVLPNKFRTSLRWFSRRGQNAWDLRKFCAYKRDNAVQNYFRAQFRDNLVTSFGLFGVFWGNLPLHLCLIPERKQSLAGAGFKILGLSAVVIEQGLKQQKGCSLIHFFNPV